MNSADQSPDPEPSIIDQAIAEYLVAYDARRPIPREEFLKRYPDIRAELEEFLANELNAQEWIQSPTPMPLPDLERTVDYRPASLSNIASGAPSEMESTQLGSYRLVAFLGEGGMGRVYEAIDPSGHQVAIKVLNRQWSQNPDSMSRFKQEGALASTINHPRCVFVRAVDEVDGQPFIVMELMSGKTLRDLVTTNGPLPVSEAVACILDIIDGLSEAHIRGVIHRDIKPANCFLEPSGRVKLGDFGLARSIQQDSELTQTGNFIGTPLFASPEQIRGESLDFRTDIYSVCATLYYLITGKAPFGQYSATQVIARIVSDDPVPIRQFNPALPKLLEHIIQRGLSRNRERRYQDLNELRSALAPFVSGRQAIAQLARRIAAYGFDACLLTCLLFAVAAMLGDQVIDPAEQTFGFFLLTHGIVWLYYIAFESIWSATPGKMALQLRIVDSRTGEPASFARILARTAVYLCVGSEFGGLALYLLGDDTSPQLQVLLQVGFAFVGLALLALPLRSKQGSRMLQDLLSHTIVVANHNSIQPVSLLPIEPLAELGLTAPVGWPSQLGAYEVRGIVWQAENQALLSGRDPRLNRSVWLLVETQPFDSTQSVSPPPARSSRLRFLADGLENSCRWQAYVAPEGAPLRYWVSPERHLSWREARVILEQLLDEFQQMRCDHTGIQLTSLDQLWLDSQGRVLLSQWALDAPQQPPSPEPTNLLASIEQPLSNQSNQPGQPGQQLNRAEAGFAVEAMRLCMTGKSHPLNNMPVAIAAPQPNHARQLLSELIDSCSPDHAGLDLPTLKTRVHDSANRPSTITTTVRLWMIGLSAVALLPLIGVMVSIPRVANQVAVLRLEDYWLEASALEQIARNPEWQSDWQTSFDRDKLQGTSNLALSSLDTLLVLDRYKQICVAAIKQRWYQSSAMQHQILAGGYAEQLVVQTPEVRFERGSEGERFLRLVDGPPRNADTHYSAARLAERWQEIGANKFPLWPKRVMVVIGITLAPMFGLWIWTTLARGGLPYLLLGVYIVRQDGTPAPRWLMAVRSLLVWLPFMLMSGLILAIDLRWPEFGWLASTLHLGMLGLLILYAGLALRWPACGVHDWLVGTRLVPD